MSTGVAGQVKSRRKGRPQQGEEFTPADLLRSPS